MSIHIILYSFVDIFPCAVSLTRVWWQKKQNKLIYSHWPTCDARGTSRTINESHQALFSRPTSISHNDFYCRVCMLRGPAYTTRRRSLNDIFLEFCPSESNTNLKGHGVEYCHSRLVNFYALLAVGTYIDQRSTMWSKY